MDEVSPADGFCLSATDLTEIIQAMQAYAEEEKIEMNSLDDVCRNVALMGIIAESWHG